MEELLVLREVGPAELPAVQELIEADPAYTERVTGHPPGDSDALSLVLARPEGLPEDAKVVLGAWERADRLVAVADLLRGWPSAGTAFVGVLQVRWELQRSGFGRVVWQQVESWVSDRWPEVERMRLAVVDTNARVAEPFWRSMGFAPTGEEKPYRYDKLESTARMYEKAL